MWILAALKSSNPILNKECGINFNTAPLGLYFFDLHYSNENILKMEVNL